MAGFYSADFFGLSFLFDESPPATPSNLEEPSNLPSTWEPTTDLSFLFDESPPVIPSHLEEPSNLECLDDIFEQIQSQIGKRSRSSFSDDGSLLPAKRPCFAPTVNFLCCSTKKKSSDPFRESKKSVKDQIGVHDGEHYFVCQTFAADVQLPADVQTATMTLSRQQPNKKSVPLCFRLVKGDGYNLTTQVNSSTNLHDSESLTWSQTDPSKPLRFVFEKTITDAKALDIPLLITLTAGNYQRQWKVVRGGKNDISQIEKGRKFLLGNRKK